METKQLISPAYLVKQLPTPTLFINTRCSIVYASDAITTIIDQDPNALYGENLFSVFSQLSPLWKKKLKASFNGTLSYLGTQVVVNTKKQKTYYKWSHTCWYDADENIIGAIIEIQDVTASRATKVSLQKNKMLLKQQSEISKIGVWEFDIQKNHLMWCSMTKVMHEVHANYNPNVDSAILFYKEGYSRNAISMALHEAITEGNPWSLKLQIITAKGNEKWVLAAGKPIFENGDVTGVIGTFQDINEQVLTENKTSENAKLLNTLIDNLPLNVFVKDLEFKKILVNRSECEFLDVSNASELIGKTDFELYPEETAKVYWEQDNRVIDTLKPILREETVSYKHDGTKTVFLNSKIPLLNEKGKPTGLIGISLDITSLKEKEIELLRLINISSIQNKKLINFAHIVSHNLRSHSANFSMLLNFLKDEKDENEKENIVTMLCQASDNLLETLENLNEVVALNSDVKTKAKVINLHDKITQIQHNFSSLTKNQKLSIINQVPESETIEIIPAYLESILMNFITNGVKYKHPDRPAKLCFSTEKIEDYTILSIKDNGIGIDLTKHGNKLFGMYKTFHNNEDARGIGLYITKNQIEAMQGKIEVESVVGEGTTFKVFFK